MNAAMNDKKGIVLTEEQIKQRNRRSVAIALVLAALVGIFFVVTIVKLGPAAFKKSEAAAISVQV